MTQTSVPRPFVPSGSQDPTLPHELMPLALEETPVSAPATAPMPPPIFELSDDRYYAYHWGINE